MWVSLHSCKHSYFTRKDIVPFEKYNFSMSCLFETSSKIYSLKYMNTNGFYDSYKKDFILRLTLQLFIPKVPCKCKKDVLLSTEE
jgi:hypothetical protein